MKFALDAVRALDVKLEHVVMVGGGAKSRAVLELAEEFLGATVTVPKSGEYVALGAARQAARVMERAGKAQ